MMAKAKTSGLEQLDALGRAVGAAKMRMREAELEHSTALRTVEDLQRGLVNALAGDDDDLAQRLQAERDQAERPVRDVEDRLKAARLQAERAEAARREFASGNLDVLLSEHAGAAQAAAEGVEVALDQLQSAAAAWREAEGRRSVCSGPAGDPRNGRRGSRPSSRTSCVRSVGWA